MPPAIRHLSTLCLIFGRPFYAFGMRAFSTAGMELPKACANDEACGPEAA